MAYSFEVVLTFDAKEIFQEAFFSHLGSLGFTPMSLTGGGQEVAEFRRGDDLVSLSVTGVGHGEHRLAVHSETTPVDDLVADSLREAASRLLEPFCYVLTGSDVAEFRETLSRGVEELILKIRRGEF